jgi:hypothetical protein
MAKRNRNPVVGGQSKLTNTEAHKDSKMTDLNNNMREGSVALLAAILKTGKLYRTMTPTEQIEARLYAYGPDLVDKRTWK